MKLVIFSGTTEGRTLSVRMAQAGAEVTVCVASEYGLEEEPELPGIRTLVGPLTKEEKHALLSGAALCVDATHPYATHVTASVLAACGEAGVPYHRLLRPPSKVDDAFVAASASEAAAYLAGEAGNILLTTGTKDLDAFSVLDPTRLYPRTLPSHAALDACEAAGIPHRNIIAMQGPFSRELNEALLRQYQISFLVTKDGGAAGGFPEKADAARAVGARLIVIRRPEETGLSFEQIERICLEALERTSN